MIIPDIFSRPEQDPEKEYKRKLEAGFINDWSESVTGEFNEEELERLRNDHPKVLADFFYLIREGDDLLPIEALYEIYAHGNEQKAALVARALVKKIPDFVEDIETFFEERIATELLEGNILKMKKGIFRA